MNAPTRPTPPAPADAESLSELLSELRAVLPPGALLSTEEQMRPYECDGLSMYRRLPLCVALPMDEAQVAAVLRICHAHGVPVGGELEFIDGGTLARALSGRREIESAGEGGR